MNRDYQRRTCTLHEKLCTFMIIPLSVLLIMRNVSDRFGENIKTRILCSVTFFQKIIPFMRWCGNIAQLPRQCHNSKFVIFQEKSLKVLQCYAFLWVQRRHKCSPASSFADCVMTPYLLKVHLQTFLSIPTTQKLFIYFPKAGTLTVRHWPMRPIKVKR